MLDLASIQPALSALGIWAPVGFILLYATATVLFFSGAILSLAGGALFGPVWGTAGIWLGATLGASARLPPCARQSAANGWRGGLAAGCDAWLMA